MYKSLISLTLALSCAACAETTPVPDLPQIPQAGQCDPGTYAAFIGQNEEIFARATFPAPMRIIPPGSAVTMDFRPDRVNFDLDADGTITRVWCG